MATIAIHGGSPLRYHSLGNTVRRERTMFWVIDRFEGTMAVCTNDAREKRDIPSSSLPRGLKEGDVLRERDGRYESDEGETARRRKDINDLVKGMWA